jgi:branched-chain amino acid transport system permease protein
MTRSLVASQVVLAVIVGVAFIVLLPLVAPLYTLINATLYASMAIFALSLALLWGFGGILCFGQSAFFGLGAYAYAIAAINLGDTTIASAIAMLVPTLFAAALGYFLFFGRLNDVYLGVVTLTATLILFKLINSTGGDSWRIGKARIGGFNGIPNTPPLRMPFGSGQALTPSETFVLAVVCLVAVYALCKWLTVTDFGRAVAAVRENEVRAELLGYNSKRLKLAIFCISAAIAGLAGLLFANCVFVSPTIFGLSTAAQVLIWVVVGGLGTFVGPVIACVALQMLAGYLGKLGWIDPNIVLGALLVAFVVLVPSGLQPTATRLWSLVRDRARGEPDHTAAGPARRATL